MTNMRNNININKNIINQSQIGFFSVALSMYLYLLPTNFGGDLRRVLSS